MMNKALNLLSVAAVAAIIAGCNVPSNKTTEKDSAKIAKPSQTARIAAGDNVATIRVEAEKFCVDKEWPAKELAGASDGKAVESRLGRYAWGNDPFDHLPQLSLNGPAEYVCWVRYYKMKSSTGGFLVVLRDETGEEVGVHKCHFKPRIEVMRPYSPSKAGYLSKKGFVWEKFNFSIESPTNIRIALSNYFNGARGPKSLIDCFVFTTDLDFNPEKVDLKTIQERSAAPIAFTASAQDGWVESAGHPVNSAFYSSLKNPREQFALSMVNNSSLYRDYARLVGLGFNMDHNHTSKKYGITSTMRAMAYMKLNRKYAKPEGYFVNAKGVASKRTFSLSFPALKEHLAETLKKALSGKVDDKLIRYWTISGEQGGFFDYSHYSVKAFREWLRKKHGTIAAVNKNWNTNYKSFEDVQPAKSPQENLGNWFEFREFSGQVFSEAVGRQIPIIRQLDPLKRPCIAQSSNLNILAPYFTAMRPMDYEQFNRIALKGEKYLAWDGYSVDDFVGCEFDLLQSLAPDKKLLLEEWNTHTPDPRICGRTAWGVIMKGARGLAMFQFQEGTNHNSYPKWAFLNNDFTPKKKLAAVADIAHEIKRIEPILTSADRATPVKPVAMYYSTLDLALAKPESSLWGAGHDNHYRVYSTLRGLGYQVRWITPRLIEKGELANVAALVMVDCQYVPAKAATLIKKWTEQGGAIIADRWPGAKDEYGRPQSTLSGLFGVKSSPKKKKSSSIAIEEAETGYGPETGNAFNPDDMKQTIIEIYQQWDAKNSHPLAKAIGNYMLSGYGYQRVKCTSGIVMGMAYDRGYPGLVLNEPGKGKTLYFSALMGTLFDSSATRFEWDSTHSGGSFGRILDKFLAYAGAKHLSEMPNLTPRVSAKIRVEAPLVDPNGNMVIGLTSYNDAPVGDFVLKVKLPKNARDFAMVLAAVGGNRELTQLPFTVENGELTVTMPKFDSTAELIALKSFQPLIGLSLRGAERCSETGLAKLHPDQSFTITATIYNPTNKTLPKGETRLFLPKGWFAKFAKITVGEIAPRGNTKVEFQIKTPKCCGSSRLRPLVVKYAAGNVKSTPSTELVWWGKK